MSVSRSALFVLALLVPFLVCAQEPQTRLVCGQTASGSAKRVSGKDAVYPSFAEFTKIGGSVHLRFIIARDGTVRNVSALRGHPLLLQSAIDAVRTWRYAPILVNGNAVEVVALTRVDFYLNGHSFANVIARAREDAAKRPNDPKTHLALGSLLSEIGDVSAAAAEVNEVLLLKPDLSATHFEVARAAEANCDFTGAVAEYRKGLDIEPKSQAGHRDLAGLLEKEGLYDQALTEYTEAMRIDPDNARLHFSLGRCLLEKKDFDGAIPELRQALKKEKDFPAANFALGLAFEQKGKPKEALEQYHKATKGAKDNPAYLAAYNRLREGSQK